MSNSKPSSPPFAGSYTDNLQKYSAELPNQFDGEMSALFQVHKSWGMGGERKGRRLIVLDKEIGMNFTAGEGFRARKNLFIPKEHGILKTLGFISSTRP